MNKLWEVTWEGELPASPQAVWDTFTKHSGSYLWPIEYEPRVGGAESGLNRGGGTVTVWEPHRQFRTRSRVEAGSAGFNELEITLEPLGDVTYLRYTHRAEVPEAEYDLQLAMCRAHTTFYQHSLGVAACYFHGLEAHYESDDAVEGTFAEVLQRLGVPEGAVAGDRVRLTNGIEGVIDAFAGSFLGVRGSDVTRLRARHLGLSRGHHDPPVPDPNGGVMAQYAVFLYERVPPQDLPPEIMEGHMTMPDRVAELGGKIVAGMALQPPETSTSIRGGELTDGPFLETKEVLGGVFVIEARDLDHALALAKLTPVVDGGVEVAPLVDFQVL